MKRTTLPPPDLILVGGPIYCADATHRRVEGLAVAGSNIIARGSAEDIRALAGEQTRVVELGGRSVIPGIVDSHNHLPTAGAMMVDGILLFDVESIDALQERVAEQAAKLPPGEWIRGAGWIENQFNEWRMPHRRDLDEAAPDHPVILDRLFGMSVVNTRALEAAGIFHQDPPAFRGRIDRDDLGRATGILRDGAQGLVHEIMPRIDEGDQLRQLQTYIAAAAQEYLRYGITSVTDPGVPPLRLRAYQRTREAGQLPLRIHAMPQWYGLHPGEEARLQEFTSQLGMYTGFGDEWLRLGALKMAIDGGLGSATAWMNAPFSDGTRSEIPLRLDVERLEEWFTEGHRAGWSIGIHCCGDRAQDVACRAFDAVLQRVGSASARHHIIHGYFATDESLELMQRWNLSVSAQPGFIGVEGDLYPEVVSEAVLRRFKPLKTYAERGLIVACNSDMTSAHYNPFWGLHSAITRTTRRGLQLGQEECVDRWEALRMFTYNGAYLSFEEAIKGSIEEGKRADVAVLDGDYGTVSTDALRDLQVDMTIIDGRVVYERGM